MKTMISNRIFNRIKNKQRLDTDFDQKVGLTFSGGGARGAYQIGVWKALKELGLDDRIEFVSGSSVGAINAAIMLQDDFEKTFEIWEALDYHNIFKDYHFFTDRKKLYRSPISVFLKLYKDGGFNVDPLKELIYEYMDEDKIRNSNKRLGLVVYDLTERKAIHLTMKDIPEGKLIDYIIASATFPLFQAHEINDKKFLDGGIADNRPIQFLLEAEEIKRAIIVDVTVARHFWQKKHRGLLQTIDYIAPSRLLGSPLSFDNKRIKKNIQLGYEDAMRYFEDLYK